MNATGIDPSSAPAISGPQKKTSPRISSETTPTGTVFFWVVEMKTRAYMNSFQESVKAKIPAERIPGVAKQGLLVGESPQRREVAPREGRHRTCE